MPIGEGNNEMRGKINSPLTNGHSICPKGFPLVLSEGVSFRTERYPLGQRRFGSPNSAILDAEINTCGDYPFVPISHSMLRVS